MLRFADQILPVLHIGALTMAWTSDPSVISSHSPTSVEPFTLPAHDLMNLEQTAAFVGMSKPAFVAAVRAGHFPDGIPVGNVRRWSKRALAEWIADAFLRQRKAA